jgi:hypothetical protein
VPAHSQRCRPLSPQDFRAWVAQMRERNGWTKTRCARELGTTPVQIKRWETYHSPPYIDLAVAALVKGLRPWRDESIRPASD